MYYHIEPTYFSIVNFDTTSNNLVEGLKEYMRVILKSSHISSMLSLLAYH